MPDLQARTAKAMKTDNGKNQQDRINRITENENLFDNAASEVKQLAQALEACQELPAHIAALEAYLDSGAWREDYEADERGEVPTELKRGVLSQDALYDLLTDYRELKSQLEFF